MHCVHIGTGTVVSHSATADATAHAVGAARTVSAAVSAVRSADAIALGRRCILASNATLVTQVVRIILVVAVLIIAVGLPRVAPRGAGIGPAGSSEIVIDEEDAPRSTVGPLLPSRGKVRRRPSLLEDCWVRLPEPRPAANDARRARYEQADQLVISLGGRLRLVHASHRAREHYDGSAG